MDRSIKTWTRYHYSAAQTFVLFLEYTNKRSKSTIKIRTPVLKNLCLYELRFYVIICYKPTNGVIAVSKISNRQHSILEFIKNEVREKGYPPSVREIGEAVGLLSSSTVHGHLDRLEKKGLIRRDPTKPRAIEILDQEGVDGIIPLAVAKVPIVGK